MKPVIEVTTSKVIVTPQANDAIAKLRRLKLSKRVGASKPLTEQERDCVLLAIAQALELLEVEGAA